MENKIIPVTLYLTGCFPRSARFELQKKSELENDAIKPYSAYMLISMPMHN